MGRTVSLEKIEANRRNAQRSTGPKSPEGKGTVRWNALQHGLLSSEVVIPVGEGKEQEQIKLERQRADREWNERLEQESHVASLSVPPKDAAQRILRYEATIQRELHRTIQQLARLQRLRKGKGGHK